MYNDFFGFRENPFPVTPDPRIFFSNSVYQRAYANLLYGICERKGVTVLTGEAGTGKTTLLRRLMNNLEHTVHFAFCPYTTLSFPDLVDFVCTDLGLPKQSNDCTQQIKLLQQFLIDQQLRGQYAALLIDEAHDLRQEVLIGLAQLSLLAVGDEHLLPIALAGQEELQQHLAHPTMAMLQRQVAITCQLDRLKNSEVGPFIYHRLNAVGYEQQEIFPSTTVQRIATYAQGIPRSVNIICDNALLIASIQATKVVTTEIVDEVAADLQLTDVRPIQTETYTSQSVFPPQQPLSPVAYQQRSVAKLSLPQEKRTGWKRVPIFQRRSHFILWGELGIVAVLFFLLFFHSSPVPNLPLPAVDESVSQSTVTKTPPIIQSPESSSQEAPLSAPPVALHKQAKKKGAPSATPPAIPPKDIPQITVATLFKNPPISEGDREKKTRVPRRDPFAATLPPNKDKDLRPLPTPPFTEPSLAPSALNNSQTHKRTLSSTGTKALAPDGKSETDKNSVDRSSREEKDNLRSSKLSLMKDEKNLTPLMVAVMRGQTATVRTLLNKGVEVNSQTKTGRTALMLAALAGRNEILQDLLKRGATVNTKNAEGWTALMYAAWNGHAKAVQTLITSGAQVDAKNRDGATALTQALRNGHHATVRLLRSGQARPSGIRRSAKSTTSLNQATASILLSSFGKRNEGERTKR